MEESLAAALAAVAVRAEVVVLPGAAVLEVGDRQTWTASRPLQPTDRRPRETTEEAVAEDQAREAVREEAGVAEAAGVPVPLEAAAG